MKNVFMIFKVVLFFFTIYNANAMDEPSDDLSYFKPSVSESKNKASLLRKVSQKRSLKTLDLSDISGIDDEFVIDICGSLAAHSLVNINLSKTQVTKKSLMSILQGKLGTKREFINYSQKYDLPVSEVFLNVTGSCIKDDEIAQFNTPFKIDIESSRPDSKVKIPGIKILLIRNKEFSSLRPDIPFKVVSRKGTNYFKIPSEPSTVSKMRNIRKAEPIPPFEASLVEYVPTVSNVLPENIDSPLIKAHIDLCKQMWTAKRNDELACQMISEDEPDDKILRYAQITKQKLSELRAVPSQSLNAHTDK